MPPDKRDYHIAWILSSFGQQEIANCQFQETFESCSSTLHITYIFGRIGQHNVVIAGPSSEDDNLGGGLIIDDLLQNAPSVRACFLVSSDGVAAQTGPARVGDVVIGLTVPDLEQSVTYYNAEETIKYRRLFMTGRAVRVPPVVSAAVRTWIQSDALEKLVEPSPKPFSMVHESQNSRPRASRQQSQVHTGIIASAARLIDDPGLIEKMMTQNEVVCFETAASGLKSRPFMAVTGTVNYCGHVPNRSSYDEAWEAAISYLTRLIQRIDHVQLRHEIPISDYFEYESFDLDKPACRLLRLQGGTGELHCHLFQAFLPSNKNTVDDQGHNDTMLIPYEALSYCWGSNILTDTVRVNGKVLPITENLLKALTYLRLPEKDRMLWIDAICIDQSNVLERGHQVDMMGELYSHADEVLIWLGDVGHNTESLILTLQMFEANVPREAWKQWPSKDFRFQDIWNKVHNSSEDQRSLQVSLQSSISFLMASDWFSRVWIIQEVSKAKRALLGCTGGWINARTFAIAPNLLHVAPSAQCQAIIDVMPGPSRRISWFSQKPNLSTLLWRFRHSQASDPRDKLYALLGISSDDPIASDYTKTEESVVKNVMDYWLQDMTFPEIFPVSNIADLQREIPNILSIALEKLIFQGANANEVEPFASRHTTPTFLTEHAVGYLCYIRSPLLSYFKRQASVQVVLDKSPKTDEEYSTTNLYTFLTDNKRIKITETITRVSRENGFGFAALLLEQDREDLDMNEAIIKEAQRNGSDVFDQFLVKYGDVFEASKTLIHTMLLQEQGELEASFKELPKSPQLSQKLVIEAASMGPAVLAKLFDTLDHHVEIIESAREIFMQSPSELQNSLVTYVHWGRRSAKVSKKQITSEARLIEAHLFELFVARYGDVLPLAGGASRGSIKEHISCVIRGKMATLKGGSGGWQ